VPLSRYIHLNPKDWSTFPYSSLRYYYQTNSPDFISPKRVEELFENRESYIKFLEEYEERKQEIDEVKYALADGS
jgi:hypothetical protein